MLCVPNRKNSDGSPFDHEKRSANAATLAEQELANFSPDELALAGHGTALGKFAQTLQGRHEPIEPARCGSWILPGDVMILRVELCQGRGWRKTR